MIACRECGARAVDKPYCVKHLLMMPYAAEVARRVRDGFSMECDELITELRLHGYQNYAAWKSEVVDDLVKRGICEVIVTGGRRHGGRCLVRLTRIYTDAG